jgi:phosphatidylserine/phosphatidylglycerophosphate/cardiolipin synthase-like enzyme
MPLDLGSVQLHVGPRAIGGPDDLLTAVLAFLRRARATLDVAVQELDCEPIAREIIAAAARGVRVRVVLERDYLREPAPRTQPLDPGGRHEPNRRLLAALLRAGIEVTSDLNPEIFHQKFVVRDREGSRASVLTGSTNFTDTGVSVNANHLVILDSKRVADSFGAEFEELWEGTFGALRPRHGDAPDESRLAGIRVKRLFAPDHGPEMEVMKQMLKARERVDFAVFTFAQSSGIDDTMVALQRSGITVRGILDGGQGNQRWAATRGLADAGSEIHLSRRSGGLAKLHHKLMVIDRQVVIAGSFNYTEPATRLNDENLVVLGDLHETRPAAVARQRALAGYALAEIDRLIAFHGIPVAATVP